MWIRIGKKDIEKPVNGRRVRCPISSKLYEIFHNEPVVVDLGKNGPHIVLWEKKSVASTIYIPLPLMLREWILAHDRGQDVEPIKFWLPVY